MVNHCIMSLQLIPTLFVVVARLVFWCLLHFSYDTVATGKRGQTACFKELTGCWWIYTSTDCSKTAWIVIVDSAGHAGLCCSDVFKTLTLRQKVSRCFWLWVSADNRWLDSWYATQPRNVLVITCCSWFTSLTRNMTGLIVGSAEEGLCQTLRDPMESTGSPAKCRLGAYNTTSAFFCSLLYMMLLFILPDDVQYVSI